ncbi:MAG: cell wall-active antibiotics response protein LiaF [candidate division Zixibacteria bacterium]|nr:cell wall-active antibiotics response protein LiaF [candidate division Zixibacteria bacterium]
MSKKTLIFGLILILIGIVLLGRTLDIFYVTFGEIFRFIGPVGVILLGIWLIIRKRQEAERIRADIHLGHSGGSAGYGQPVPGTSRTSSFAAGGTDRTRSGDFADAGKQASEQPQCNDSGKTRYNKVLGDMFIDCNNVSLESVEVSCGLGDTEINLSGGQLVKGLNRLIISGFIGDIRLFAPKTMAIFTHCSNFVGDIEVAGKRSTGFGNNLDWQAENYNTAESKLYVAANSFIGDIKIYSI